MNLNKNYYSYCKEIGVMKEMYSREHALEKLKKEIADNATADPAFKAIVSKLTMNSPQVSLRACMLYRYDIDLTYVVNGNIKRGNIAEFGQSGVRSELHITDWGGKGEYTVCQNFDSVPYTLYNDKNIFTFEEMKNALKGVINKRVPKGTTSYESKDWTVSCYIVPVLVVQVEYGGKTYQLAYNLQNGRYHWEWPNDPAIYKKGQKAGRFSFLLKLVGIVLSLIGLIVSATSDNFNWITIIGAAASIFLASKTKKSKNYFKNYFIKNKGAGMVKPLISGILVAVVGLVTLIIGLA